jgi:hypothetical protein
MAQPRSKRSLKVTQREPVPLNKLEYQFEACPKEELFDCWLYEFAREVDWLPDFVATQNARKLEESAHDDTFYSFLLFPKWPSEPYLSISKEERHKCIARARVYTEQKIRANSLVPRELPKGIGKALAASLRKHGRSRFHSKGSLMELALLRIHWARPDSVLVEAFQSFLKEFRPLEPDSPIRYTGKREPDFRRRMQLRQLGMFRLIRANQDNCHATHKAFRHEFKQGGVPLKKVDAWYHAYDKIPALIKEVGAALRRRLEEAHDFLF